MTNREIRTWYLEEVGKIAALDAAWLKRGDTLPQRAYQAWRARHDLRLQAREMMQDRGEVELLRDRDLARYGDSDGPSFEDLVEALRRQGLSAEAAYRKILESAQRTNTELNALMEGTL